MQPGFSRMLQPMATRGQNLDITSLISQRAASVQRFALFSGIPLADCIKIISSAQEKHFSRRQTIFFEGDPIRHIVLLLSGCVKVTQFSQNGPVGDARAVRPDPRGFKTSLPLGQAG